VTQQEIDDLRNAHAELTGLRQRGYYRLAEWQQKIQRIDAVLAALPALIDAAEEYQRRTDRQFDLIMDAIDAKGCCMEQLQVLADENSDLASCVKWADGQLELDRDTISEQERHIDQLSTAIQVLAESLMAEGLEAAKAFMETETVKGMRQEIEQLRADRAAKDAEIKDLSKQAEDERAAADDWEVDFNEERRQKVASQEREKRLREIARSDYSRELRRGDVDALKEAE
jgi:hypothetical protein